MNIFISFSFDESQFENYKAKQREYFFNLHMPLGLKMIHYATLSS